MVSRKPKYHVFFTSNHVRTCIENGRFGATSINSLVDVIKNDKAFIYNGKESLFYGPLIIESYEQFYESEALYGLNKKGIPRYTNRIAFSSVIANTLEYKQVFSAETDHKEYNYLLNRSLLSTIIENKQVHSMPLTMNEGIYLEKLLIEKGNRIGFNKSVKQYEGLTTIREKLKSYKSSEAYFETSLMLNKLSPIFSQQSKEVENPLTFNQFVIGIQRQIDILSIGEKEVRVYELKKANNISDPFKQLIEYSKLLKSDFRMNEFDILNKSIQLVALLEKGNKYLSDKNSIDHFASHAILNSLEASVFELNIDKLKTLSISQVL